MNPGKPIDGIPGGLVNTVTTRSEKGIKTTPAPFQLRRLNQMIQSSE